MTYWILSITYFCVTKSGIGYYAGTHIEQPDQHKCLRKLIELSDLVDELTIPTSSEYSCNVTAINCEVKE